MKIGFFKVLFFYFFVNNAIFGQLIWACSTSFFAYECQGFTVVKKWKTKPVVPQRTSPIFYDTHFMIWNLPALFYKALRWIVWIENSNDIEAISILFFGRVKAMHC